MMYDSSSAQSVVKGHNMARVMAKLTMSERSTRSTNSWTCESSFNSSSSLTNHSLGTGTFAEVRKAVDIETGDLRAIKVSTRSHLKKSKVADEFSKSSNIDSRITLKPSSCSAAKSISANPSNTRTSAA